MSFDAFPHEVTKQIVPLLTCRSLASAASLNRHWQEYTHERLTGYKAAIYETALNLRNALNLWTPRPEIDLKEAFMVEYLGPSRPTPYEIFKQTLIPQKRACIQLYEGILDLNLKLKLCKAILLAPPPADDGMIKHAIIYLRKALNFDHVLYLCPQSASRQLEALSKKQVERLIVHPIFFKEPQIAEAFNTHLPAFNSLKRVIITNHHLNEKKHGPLLPIIKVFDQVNTLVFIDLHLPNLSYVDFYFVGRAFSSLHCPVRIDLATYTKFKK